jgi:hypothetical protein
MVIIVLLYVFLAWLVFFRFRLLPWNWPWRIVSWILGVGPRRVPYHIAGRRLCYASQSKNRPPMIPFRS